MKNEKYYRKVTDGSNHMSKLLCTFYAYYRGVFRTISNIYDENVCNIIYQILAVDYFCQKFHHRCFGNNKNTFILDATVDYFISIKRFDEPLFNSSWAFVSLALKSCIQYSFKFFISDYLYLYSLLGYFFYIYDVTALFYFFCLQLFFPRHQYIYI